jgi:hypothetical protein
MCGAVIEPLQLYQVVVVEVSINLCSVYILFLLVLKCAPCGCMFCGVVECAPDGCTIAVAWTKR